MKSFLFVLLTASSAFAQFSVIRFFGSDGCQAAAAAIALVSDSNMALSQCVRAKKQAEAAATPIISSIEVDGRCVSVPVKNQSVEAACKSLFED